MPGKKFVESKAANGAAKVECSAVAHGVLPQKDGKPVPQPQKSDFAYTDGNSGGDTASASDGGGCWALASWAAASKKNAGTGLQDIAVTPSANANAGPPKTHPGGSAEAKVLWADPRSFERADPGSGPEVFDITFSLGLETLLDATGEDGYAKASLHHDAWVDIAGYGDSHLFDLDASVDSNGAFSCTFTYQSGLTWLNGTDPTQVASQLAAYYDAATSTWSLPQDYTISLEVPISVDVDIFDFGWDTQVNSQASATPELSTWALLGCSGLLGVGMLRRRRVA